MIAYINWNVKPQIFSIGSYQLRWYSVMFMVGFILGYYILLKIFKKEGLPVELLDKLTFYMVIATIIGARLGQCLFYEPNIYLKHPLKIILPFEWGPGVKFHFTGYQGLASHGGVIGILIALYLYSRKIGRPYIWILDRIGIAIGPALSMIRIGNLFNSEIYGHPTNLPWGFRFMRETLEYGTPPSEIVPKHPTQIYEALCYLVIFIILIRIYYKRYPNLKPGLLFGLSLILNFSARFLVEFLKQDQEAFEKHMILNMGQLLSIPFIIVGFFLVFRKVKTPEKEEETIVKTAGG